MSTTNNAEARVVENPAEWGKELDKLHKQCLKAIKDRVSLDAEAFKVVLADRDRRFYRAILINKTGMYNYHVRNDKYKELYRTGLEYVRNIKPVWDGYVWGIVEKGALRQHALEGYPKLKDMEEWVEYYIAFSEFIASVCVDGGCSPNMFSIEALETLSAMIDEGCVVGKNNHMRVIKEPSFEGWRKYFGPGKTLANM